MLAYASVNGYKDALLAGCRSVEIDVFSGSKNEPEVRHSVVTGRVSLLDVLQTIEKYAFVASKYPVCISIENHCDFETQKNMAKYIREVFGEKLVTEPVDPNEKVHPS